MTAQVKGNAVVGQSGGPTRVINQSLVGVIEEIKEHPCIKNAYGAIHAVRGIVNEDFIDLNKISQHDLEDIARTPSATLGSSRDKPDQEYCNRIFDVFRKNNVRYFFYIGGNDSASTASIVNDLAQDANYDLKVFHIPKTIDNDLLVTDHCIGYGTAATFVAHALIGDDLDNRALPGIKIDIIMGRHAGFLTAATMLARRREDDGPHLIYVPERPISMEQFVDDIIGVNNQLGRCVVAVSEGISDTDGTLWATKLQESAEKDAHGNVQLSGSGALGDALAAKIKEVLPEGRVRADTFGYLQRSFPGIVSPRDAYEARYTGRMAVHYATIGPDTKGYATEPKTAGSVCMQRFGEGDRYRIETFLTTLASVAVKTKSLDEKYINEAGNNINQSFYTYVSPLVGPLPDIGYVRSTKK